jgi:hypothetical protein
MLWKLFNKYNLPPIASYAFSMHHPQDSEKIFLDEAFHKIRFLKTKMQASFYIYSFAIKLSTNKVMGNQLQPHCLCTFLQVIFLFCLPESLFIKAPRGSAFASGGPLGFESQK